MIKLNTIQQQILLILFKKVSLSPAIIHEELMLAGFKHSSLTTKRNIYALEEDKYVIVHGKGRSSNYELSILGQLFSELDAKEYCAIEVDKRYGLKKFNFSMFNNFPQEIFSKKEKNILDKASQVFITRSKDLSDSILKRELERLVVEFSWKSSKLEGNTYSLLDTEKLLLENKRAEGKTEEETRMIINHKRAFDYVNKNIDYFKKLNKKNIFEVHSILVDGLGIDKNFRSKPVGITGSLYQPLDNKDQIEKALDDFIEIFNNLKSPYDKALLVLVMISYIQAFDDGNKRTARVLAIAVLLAHNLAPLSYRSVDEKIYRDAILCFYELNSIVPFKQIFIDQYVFSANNYLFHK